MQDITTPQQLEAVFEESFQHPVLLYKHSRTCPLSTWAYEEVKKLEQAFPLPVYRLVVQDVRPLSNEVAARTGVRHETPQVLLLHQGEAVFHTSHSKIQLPYLQKKLKPWLSEAA